MKPLGRTHQGRFASLTPEIDRRQEYWENVVSLGMTQIHRCEKARWKVREAVEQRKVLCVDFEARNAPPPRRAA